MAKKAILLLLVIMVCGAAVFAQERPKAASGISAGVGGFIGGGFWRRRLRFP
jgi:F0F1-type ATP synthase assembly protein I